MLLKLQQGVIWYFNLAKNRIEGRGLGDKSFNLEAVMAPAMNFFRFTKIDLREEFLVDMG